MFKSFIKAVLASEALVFVVVPVVGLGVVLAGATVASMVVGGLVVLAVSLATGE